MILISFTDPLDTSVIDVSDEQWFRVGRSVTFMSNISLLLLRDMSIISLLLLRDMSIISLLLLRGKGENLPPYWKHEGMWSPIIVYVMLQGPVTLHGDNTDVPPRHLFAIIASILSSIDTFPFRK